MASKRVWIRGYRTIGSVSIVGEKMDMFFFRVSITQAAWQHVGEIFSLSHGMECGPGEPGLNSWKAGKRPESPDYCVLRQQIARALFYHVFTKPAKTSNGPRPACICQLSVRFWKSDLKCPTGRFHRPNETRTKVRTYRETLQKLQAPVVQPRYEWCGWRGDREWSQWKTYSDHFDGF